LTCYPAFCSKVGRFGSMWCHGFAEPVHTWASGWYSEGSSRLPTLKRSVAPVEGPRRFLLFWLDVLNGLCGSQNEPGVHAIFPKEETVV